MEGTLAFFMGLVVGIVITPAVLYALLIYDLQKSKRNERERD